MLALCAVVVIAAALGASSCRAPSEPGGASGARAAARASDVPRQAWFGDLHVHTRWSFDAYSMGVRVGPEDAYRYARGEEIDHVSGGKIRLSGPPLDFMALTEHGAYMGVSATVDEPGHPLRRLPLIQDLVSDDTARRQRGILAFLQSLGSGVPIPELASDEFIKPTWRRIVELANAHDEPGVFTAFVAYEYTPMPQGQNLHRNVIFRGGDVPDRPFSSLDSQNPEDLWDWLDRVRATGDDVIAIPHNGNASNGLMYASAMTNGDAIDAAYAAQRMRNEPVSEVYQIKGQSETHPELSPNDPWAAFEIFDRVLGNPAEPSEPRGSYVRAALRLGLEMEESDGINPYEIGMIGASDGHNAAGPFAEDEYFGKLGAIDATPEVRLGTATDGLPAAQIDGPNIVTLWGSGGLAGVWATENTRAALFDALRRRETFATSGPRIRVRFFGGFGLADDVPLAGDAVERAYAQGVPMGGELAAAPGHAGPPRFAALALQDPGEAPLERLQLIKGWIEDGRSQEKVYDVACADGSAPSAPTWRCASGAGEPDASSCEPDARAGAAELEARFADPEFQPGQRAFYYLRVLQVPTCRWSTYDAMRLGVEPPAHVPTSIQERAVTSPIWYAPPAAPAAASAPLARAASAPSS